MISFLTFRLTNSILKTFFIKRIVCGHSHNIYKKYSWFLGLGSYILFPGRNAATSFQNRHPDLKIQLCSTISIFNNNVYSLFTSTFGFSLFMQCSFILRFDLHFKKYFVELYAFYLTLYR